MLYVESDGVQISRYGFLLQEPKSIWVSLEDSAERERLDRKLARLHEMGILKFFVVSACCDGDDSSHDGMHQELNRLAQMRGVELE